MIPSVILVTVLVTVILYLLFSQLGEDKPSKPYDRYDRYNQYDERKRYGDKGEKQATRTLERYLPAGYTVIHNIIVTVDGSEREIDNVVVGRTGIFVIEVKSLKGVVKGDCNEYNWIQRKVDDYGIEHTKATRNPVKQVSSQVWYLKQYLKYNNINIWINKAVYFTEPKTRYHITNVTEDCPVFTYKTTDKLIDYILSGDANLSDNTVNKIINLLQ